MKSKLWRVGSEVRRSARVRRRERERERESEKKNAPFIIRQLLTLLLAHSSPFAIALIGQVAHVAHQQDGDILFC
jgi:hypothetical protein